MNHKKELRRGPMGKPSTPNRAEIRRGGGDGADDEMVSPGCTCLNPKPRIPKP